jgi:hypothetical protein
LYINTHNTPVKISKITKITKALLVIINNIFNNVSFKNYLGCLRTFANHSFRFS